MLRAIYGNITAKIAAHGALGMAKYMYCAEIGAMIDKDLQYAPVEDRKAWAEANKKRKKGWKPSKPMVISDDLGKEGVLNHADGKMYDSKTAYEAAVKAAGCEIVGNDAPRKNETKELSKNERKQDIANAMNQLGY